MKGANWILVLNGGPAQAVRQRQDEVNLALNDEHGAVCIASTVRAPALAGEPLSRVTHVAFAIRPNVAAGAG